MAGKLPAGQVGETLEFIKYDVCGFWISSEVELATHCGVSSSCKIKKKTLINILIEV